MNSKGDSLSNYIFHRQKLEENLMNPTDKMSKFDYSNGFVDKKDRKRLYFFEEITDILVMYDSTNSDVNELIYWLYSLSRSVSYREYKIRK